MNVVTTIAEMNRVRGQFTGSVGFVPTMGYLHEGHLELVRRARRENVNVVVSIFINPAQFGPREDLGQYPRDTERDLGLLKNERIGTVFMPSAEEVYPPGFATWIDVEGVTERLEGAARPGHFRGVATVVAVLLNIVGPDRAYFGEKDAQQLVVIRRMVSDLHMSPDVVAVPTVREADGLAMSSRNVYLGPEERAAAPVLWRALCRARELYDGGERRAQRLRREMTRLVKAEPLARIDYVSVAHPETLEELEEAEGRALASLAVRIGKTRLIDNVTLGG
ncbi:MAG: pantoate--beta-alanine ligase [Chloroflexota bacterium]|nr:pantoate--beta-alanine ligase [Chloroflexota bacterium]